MAERYTLDQTASFTSLLVRTPTRQTRSRSETYWGKCCESIRMGQFLQTIRPPFRESPALRRATTARSGLSDCAIHLLSVFNPAPAECISTTSEKTTGRRLTMALPEQTTDGPPAK